MGCAHQKANKLLVELEQIGLIERKRQGQVHPTKIYVKNFIECPYSAIKNDEKQNSKGITISTQECPNSSSNNTDVINTKMNNTDLILSKDTDMDERDAYQAYFMEQLEFPYLLQEFTLHQDRLYEILELLVDTVSSNRSFIYVAGDRKPINVVKSRVMKLDSSHIQYVMNCLDENSTDIRNIKQYLLATLYNAPLTISNYYTALVQSDRANGRI